MSNHNYNFRDDAFNPDQAYSYVLVIQAAGETFSYAVIYNNYLVAWEHGCDIARLNAADPILDAQYKKVVIGLAESGFTLMPDVAFNAEHVEQVARFLDVKDGEKVYSQPLDSHNQVIFKTNERLADTLTGKFPAAAILFGAKGWVVQTAQSDPSYRSLYLNLNNDTLEVLNFKNGKLRFFNSFEVKYLQDVIYFTSVVASELSLQPQAMKLILSGDAELVAGYNTELAEYFNEVVVNDLKPVNLPAIVEANKVLSLAALSLCAL